MDPVLKRLIKKFQNLDKESQEKVIKKLQNEGEEELVKALKKIQKAENRRQKMGDLVDQILDKLE